MGGMTNDSRGSIANFVQDRLGYLFLALLPVAVWLTNSNVLGNVNGDVDTWFYFGNFLGLGQYSGYEFNGPGDYYATRLPYLLPGYVIFHLFPLAWAKVVFAYLLYSTIIWALFYTLRAFMAERTVVLALMLFACDIFFTREVNWNYVDGGVTAYLALTFASLTAGRASARKKLWAGISAFFFTCSVFCHLGVALSIFAVAGYGWLCFEPEKLSRKQFLELFYAALAGVAICQTVVGVLNVWINHGSFFFFLLLYKIAHGETHSLNAWEPPWHLMILRSWLVIPFAVWAGSGVSLFAALLRLIRLDRFQTATLLGAFFTCSLLYILDLFHFSYYLSRSGMYVSLYMIIFYMGVAGLLSRGEALSVPQTLLVGAAFLFSLLARLHFNEMEIPWLPAIDAQWKAGLAIGLLLAAFFLTSRRILKVAILCLAAIPTLFIRWNFEGTRDAYKAFMTVREMAGKELPRIWARQDDPLYRNVILPMTASFSERGWWARGDTFPDVPPDAWDNDAVFIASSTIHSPSQAEELLRHSLDRIVPVTSRTLHLSSGNLWIGKFRAWNRMGFLGKISPKLLQEGKIPASEMPGLHGKIVGTSRVAIEGEKGRIMFGPYMSLAPGKYLVTIVYGPSTGDQTWDIASQQNDRATTIVGGKFPPTEKQNGRIAVPLNLARRASGLEIRAQYSGTGQLAIHRVGVKPLPDR